jgi:tetratricopeptide (TPR) repeat protein
MKANRGENIIKANKIFTDREEPRRVFWDTYEEFKKNLEIQQENDIKVITYYGIGGIGKSHLLKQLRKELDERIKKPLYIYVDFERIQDTRVILQKMRDNLQQDYNFQFPMYDLAMYVYLNKIGENGDALLKEIKSLTDKSPALSSLLDMVGLVPGADSVITIIKSLDNIIASARNNRQLKNRKKELVELQNEEPSFILKNLPYYFAGDFQVNIIDNNEPFVIFFDTYEALVNELSGIGEPLNKDFWIRDEIRGLIPNIANVLWVIAGREKIKWERFNSEWNEALDQHLLGDLSEKDSISFLENAGLTDLKLRKEIYQMTKGTPIYLDLCVENYYRLINKAEIPSIENIGRDINELIERYVIYLDDNKKDLIYMLSCLDEWNEELLLALASDILIGASYTSIDKIKDFSFIQTQDEINFTMHKTLQEILFKECPKSILKKTNSYMESYLNTLLDYLSPLDYEYTTTIRRHIFYKIRNISNIEEFIELYNETHNRYMKLLRESHRYNDLCLIQELLVELAIREYGEKLTIDMLYMDYSFYLFKAGRYKESLVFSQKVVELKERIYGKKHPETIKALHNLSMVFSHAGMLKEALELSEKVAELSEKVLGEENPDTINALNNLSGNYVRMGKINEASKLLVKILQLCERVLDEDHPYSIEAINNLLIVCNETGKVKEALELSEILVESRKNTLGEEHPDTIGIMNNLSIYYSKMGMKKEAMEVSEKVVELSEKVLGEEHPQTIIAMDNLSIFYSKMEMKKEAMEVSERVVELSEKVLGEEHPETIRAMDNLSSLYNGMGMKKEAMEVSERVVELSEKILGEEHPETIRIMDNLSNLYSEINMTKEAIERSKRVVELSQRNLGIEHPDTFKAMNNLSIHYLKAGMIKEAIGLTESTVELRKKALGEEHPDTLKEMSNLSQCYFKAGKTIEALELLEKAVEKSKKILGAEHPHTIQTMSNLPNYYFKAGRTKEALELSEKVWELSKMVFGEEASFTLHAYKVLESFRNEV